MTLDEAIRLFGSGSKLCKTLKISRQNITDWRNRGYIPAKHQLKIQQLSGNLLKASINDTEYKEHE